MISATSTRQKGVSKYQPHKWRRVFKNKRQENDSKAQTDMKMKRIGSTNKGKIQPFRSQEEAEFKREKKMINLKTKGIKKCRAQRGKLMEYSFEGCFEGCPSTPYNSNRYIAE